MRGGHAAIVGLLLTVGGVPASTAIAAEELRVVAEAGHLRIHVDAGGLFGAFAHDHVIEAREIRGRATLDGTSGGYGSLALTFPAAKLEVVDAKADAEEREKIRRTMAQDVLRADDFPEISFRSTAIAEVEGKLRVEGELTIRGESRPLTLPVSFKPLDDGTYEVAGACAFKQTTFGIEPIKLFAGTIRVKDEVRVEFELVLAPAE